MRLLHVIRSLDPQDGGIVALLDQLMRLHEGRDGSRIITLDPPEAPWLASLPYPVTALGPGRGTFGYCPKLVRWIRDHAKSYDAGIVHGLWQYPSLALRQTKRYLPYAMFPHGMLDAWIAETYPQKHAKKSWYWTLAERHAFRFASAVLFTAKEEMENSTHTFKHYPVGKDHVVGAGLRVPAGSGEEDRKAFLDAFPELKQRRFLLYLSRLHDKKAPELVLNAFAKLHAKSDLMLVMAGTGQPDYVEILRSQVPEELRSRVMWTGHLEGKRKWGAFHAADAFVLTSHQENFCLAAVEALGCCLPVLLSNRVNIWREITQENAGLVAEDTADGALRLLQQWESLTPEAREQMRVAAFDCYRQHFDLAPFDTRLKDTLREAIGQQRGADEPPV